MLAREALVQVGLAPRLPDLPTMLLLHPLPLPGLPALEVLASPLLLPVLAELAPLRLALLGLALLLEAPVLLRLLRPVAGLPALEVLVHAFLLLTLARQPTLGLSRLAARVPFPHLGRGGPGRHRVGAGENAGLEHGLRRADAESSPGAPGDPGRKRGPTDVAAAGPPRDPSGPPLVAGDPDPLVGRVPVPPAVVEDGPTEVLVGEPKPAVVIGPDPTPVGVGAPAVMDTGSPGPAVPDLDPVAIGRQIFVEKADVHFKGHAVISPRGDAAPEPQRESE